uniref:Uncharacterized protein n=1 Tax=Amphimedon queenslandica TaxID=400682 RepID=A0A1X7U1L5_AMPQE
MIYGTSYNLSVIIDNVNFICSSKYGAYYHFNESLFTLYITNSSVSNSRDGFDFSFYTYLQESENYNIKGVGLRSNIVIEDCQFHNNINGLSFALSRDYFQLSKHHVALAITVKSCSIRDNTFYGFLIEGDLSTSAHISVIDTELVGNWRNAIQRCLSILLSNITVTNSVSTGLVILTSVVTVENRLVFRNNTGVVGGGIVINGSSVVALLSSAKLGFVGNHAFYKGGGMYIDEEISNINSMSPIPLILKNNTAGVAGNDIYGRTYAIFHEFFNTTIPSTSSDPRAFAFCDPNSDETTPIWFYDEPQFSVFPGQTLKYNVALFGFSSDTNSCSLTDGRLTIEINGTIVIDKYINNCSQIQYTTKYTTDYGRLNITLIITTDTSYSTELDIPVILNECPIGFSVNSSGVCDCSVSRENVTCDINSLNITHNGLLWIGTYDTSTPFNANTTNPNACIINEDCLLYCSPNPVTFQLNDTDTQCVDNRGQRMCGSCRDGYSLLMGSNKCGQCHNDYMTIAWIALFAVMGVLLVVLLIVLNLTVSVGTLNGLLFYANIVKLYEPVFSRKEGLPVLSQVVSWINLDFGFEICFYNGIDEYHSVYGKVKSISASWKSFAISLRLRITDINTIEASSHGDATSCLQKVLEYWLMKDYDYERYGCPCWRMVCVAVKEGGRSSALADEIACEHPLLAATGGATPHPLPATTGGTTPYSVSGPRCTDVINYNEGTSLRMSPLGGGNSSHNESLPAVAIRDVFSNDDVMSPESGKLNNSRVYASHPEINFPLTNEIHELQDEFADALQLTMDSFLSKPDLLPKVIEYLKRCVHALLGPIKKNNPATVQAVREEFSDSETMTDLFTTLEYNGGLLKDADAVQFDVKGVPPGTRVMIAKVDCDNYTLDDLFFFRRAIPKGFDVPEMRFYFSVVTPGSLLFKHLIPEYYYSLLFPLTTKLQQQLASLGITELTCGEDKYDLREFSIEDVRHSSTDIDICDPLWYENTSTQLHEAAWRGLKDEFGYSTYHRGLHGWTPLHSASYGGHIEIVQLLIHQYGIDPNEACQSGELALIHKLELLNLFSPDDITKSGAGILHYTCRSMNNKSVKLFKYLLNQYQLSVEVKDPYGRTLLHIASWFASSSVVGYIVSIQANTCPNFNINVTTNDGLSLLHFASWTGSTLLVKALEEYNINCTLTNDDKHPVHYAALSGSTSVLSYIISQYNLNANDTDTYGRTPLVYSCWSDSINSVKYLINNHNSDSNVTDKYGMTCLNHSCCNGHINMTQYLIDVQHCDINETDNEGRMLVHHAAWSGNFDLVEYLITEQGLSPTAVTKNGLTALHYASVSLNLSLVKELITTYQLDPHQSDSNGKLPIHYAAESGHTHFIKHITSQYPQYISILHSTDNEGWVLLHLACESGNIQLVTFLINDMKCDVNAKNTHSQTCVTFVCFSGNLDVVKLIAQQCKLKPINIDKYSTTALHAAAETGHTHILEWYSQEYSVDITNHTSNNRYTLAHLAAYNGNLHCLQELINKYQCDVNATTTTGSTVLHKACEGGHVPV